MAERLEAIDEMYWIISLGSDPYGGAQVSEECQRLNKMGVLDIVLHQ